VLRSLNANTYSPVSVTIFFVGRYLDCLPDRRVDVIGEIQLPTGQHPDMIEIQVQRRFGDVHLPDNVPRRGLVGVRHDSPTRGNDYKVCHT
jgi:hypothetical protein